MEVNDSQLKERELVRSRRERWHPERLLVVVATAGDRQMPTIVYDFLQLFAHLEEGQALRWNIDRLASPRVSPGVGLVRTHGETSEAPDFYAFALLQRLRHRIKHAVHDELGTCLGEVQPLGRESIDQFAFRHFLAPALMRTRN